MRYDHQKIEAKWQLYWDEQQTFYSKIDPTKPKYYVLDMFPYTSGSGLHVGHVEGYTATDIVARHKRQKGFNVLHPMGWDSFGLPAEQHAIRTGTHPAETTQRNVNSFRKQLKKLGFSYDWTREVGTHEPRYYKWTQWIFTKLYDLGLAYEAEIPVNYCEALGTVLANEEVENGLSKEGGYPVERRPLKQWVLRITEYAERLLKDLDLLDWPEHLKRLQRNWIGRSEGATVHFPIVGTDEILPVFTTRPDTLFGTTYMVLAPEHPLIEKITCPSQREAVKAYQRETSKKSDLERTDLAKEKSGVSTGAYAINPANREKIPIWIADYVLISYGTGAVMAVPAHDERDFAFAKQFSLPIFSVYDPNIASHPEKIKNGEDPKQLHKEIIEGKRCWPGEGKCIHSTNDEISLNGLSVEDAKEKILEWLEGKGYGKRTVSYKLRDWLFSRQRYWGEPFPILHFADGSHRALTKEELPLCPPVLTDFKPAGDGQSPLAKVTDWIEVEDPLTKQNAKRESNTMPQWAGSCWYYLRFCDPHNTEDAWSQESENYWLPVDLYIGGVEHAVLHLLYARFWHKVLYDCGYVHTKEPFQSLRNQGLITSRSFRNERNVFFPSDEVEEKEGEYTHKKTGEKLLSQVEKMSKSKLNGVNPNELIEEFGADSLRLYEMFMGPLEKEKIWNTDAVSGCRRFLVKLFDLVTSDKITEEKEEQAFKLAHRLIHNVEKDLASLHFNTAIAKMMEFVNDLSKLTFYPRQVLLMATQALMPFAPHIAEEMWEILKGKGVLAYAPWPDVDPSYLTEESTLYIVQVNGKLRSRLSVPKDLPKEQVLQKVKEDARIAKYLEGKTLQKEVFVPGKLVNFVI